MHTDTKHPRELTRSDDGLDRSQEVGLFRVDPERKILQWSDGMERLTGFTANEVIGMPCLVGIRCSACLSGCGVFENDEVQDVPLLLYNKDGEEIRVLKSGSVIRGDDGKILEAVETLRLERRESNAVEEELDRLLGSIGSYWIQTDERFEIVSLSGAISELTGIPRRRFLGMPLAELLGEELFGERSYFRREIAAGLHRDGFEAAIAGSDQQRIRVSVSAGRLPEGEGLARFFLMLSEVRGNAALHEPAQAPTVFGSDLSPAERAEAARILKALQACAFHRTEAADRLGMSRTTLWRKMQRYEL